MADSVCHVQNIQTDSLSAEASDFLKQIIILKTMPCYMYYDLNLVQLKPLVIFTSIKCNVLHGRAFEA